MGPGWNMRAARGGDANGAQATEEQERELLRRVAHGDRAAFEALYGRYARRLGGYLYRLLRRPELVEEAIDDVMLVVWQKAGSFDGSARVSSWLFGIAHRKALKAMEHDRRHLRRIHAVASSLDEETSSVESSQRGDPEQRALRRDELRALVSAVEALPTEQRAVVELTFLEGRSYSEISEIMDCPVNTVKTRMFHARKSLSRALGRGAEGADGGSRARA